jgi:hypothetical protein
MKENFFTKWIYSCKYGKEKAGYEIVKIYKKNCPGASYRRIKKCELYLFFFQQKILMQK